MLGRHPSLPVLTLNLPVPPLSRPVHPDGYRTLDPSYRAHSRNQLDPYAAQPQVCSVVLYHLLWSFPLRRISARSASRFSCWIWWFSSTLHVKNLKNKFTRQRSAAYSLKLVWFWSLSLCRLAVWEVPWSYPPFRGLSQSRTVWRMISAAWAMMSQTMDWDTPCITAPCPATTMHSPMGPRAGLGKLSVFVVTHLCFRDE